MKRRLLQGKRPVEVSIDVLGDAPETAERKGSADGERLRAAVVGEEVGGESASEGCPVDSLGLARHPDDLSQPVHQVGEEWIGDLGHADEPGKCPALRALDVAVE